MSKNRTPEQGEATNRAPETEEEELAQQSTTEVSRIRGVVPLLDISGASDPTIKNK